VSVLTGSCPAIGFNIDTTRVYASDSTAYLGGKCKDIEEGTSVSVIGTAPSATNIINATSIEILK
jgi:hypothetical protein